MDSQKQQVVERLKQANNILVTVKSNPSVDQLAACIGLTLALNKLGKHATAVFSGVVPSTIEFLQPEKTLEKNTNSLQDFIIALDKSKADKLRYKVEDAVVKIFITPYRTSISQDDLQFSQGDFNVDVVLALGVHAQSDLDQAITAHGRILHDATVMTMNVAPGGDLGSVNWLDAGVSSLSELCVQLADALDQKLMDGQIATSFLTGIVAETERFSNQKTSPQTMSISAQLMAAGANQQLVASKLEEPAPAPAPQRPIAETPAKPTEAQESKTGPAPQPESPKKPDDGTIEIEHNGEEPAPAPEPKKTEAPQIHIDEQGQLQKPSTNAPANANQQTPNVPSALPPEPQLPPIVKAEGPRLMTEPPTFNTPPLTANAEPEKEDSSVNPLSLPDVGLLNREPLNSQMNPVSAPPTIMPPSSTPLAPTPPPASAPTPQVSTPSASGTPPTPFSPPSPTPPNPLSAPRPATPWTPPAASSSTGSAGDNSPKTLSQIEESVHSPHVSSDGMAASTPSSTSAPQASSPNMGTTTPDNPAPSSVIVPQAGNNTGNTKPAANTPSVSDARNLVAQAIGSGDNQPLEPIAALNAAPLGNELHPAQTPPTPANPESPAGTPSTPPAPQATPPNLQGPTQQPASDGSTPPPAVPPPMMPLPPTMPPQ